MDPSNLRGGEREVSSEASFFFRLRAGHFADLGFNRPVMAIRPLLPSLTRPRQNGSPSASGVDPLLALCLRLLFLFLLVRQIFDLVSVKENNGLLVVCF